LRAREAATLDIEQYSDRLEIDLLLAAFDRFGNVSTAAVPSRSVVAQSEPMSRSRLGVATRALR
jgi:hypothetical protein